MPVRRDLTQIIMDAIQASHVDKKDDYILAFHANKAVEKILEEIYWDRVVQNALVAVLETQTPQEKDGPILDIYTTDGLLRKLALGIKHSLGNVQIGHNIPKMQPSYEITEQQLRDLMWLKSFSPSSTLDYVPNQRRNT